MQYPPILELICVSLCCLQKQGGNGVSFTVFHIDLLKITFVSNCILAHVGLFVNSKFCGFWSFLVYTVLRFHKNPKNVRLVITCYAVRSNLSDLEIFFFLCLG